MKLDDLAQAFGFELRGDPKTEVHGIANLLGVEPGQLTFLFKSSYKKYLLNCPAAAVVLRPQDAEACQLPMLLTDQPRLAWARMAGMFDPAPKPNQCIHPSAIISETASIGNNVTISAHAIVETDTRLDDGVVIGPGCFIGERVTIGQDTQIAANVSIYHDVVIGKSGVIHSSAVIGADGFGFEFDKHAAAMVKIPQIYGVRMGDHIEIGAGTTIDRGALQHTQIGHGVKIDNQVQIGHGTKVGDHTIISGCTAIAGTTQIGEYCLIGGAVGIIDNIEIVDHVEITAMSLVSRSIRRAGRYSSGTGLMSYKLWKQNIAGFTKLNKMRIRLQNLEHLGKQDLNK